MEAALSNTRETVSSPTPERCGSRSSRRAFSEREFETSPPQMQKTSALSVGISIGESPDRGICIPHQLMIRLSRRLMSQSPIWASIDLRIFRVRVYGVYRNGPNSAEQNSSVSHQPSAPHAFIVVLPLRRSRRKLGRTWARSPKSINDAWRCLFPELAHLFRQNSIKKLARCRQERLQLTSRSISQ
jgi:hypothetical protein